MPELIDHERTGFLTGSIEEASECIKSVGIIDPVYCRQWAENRFSKTRMINDYIKVYNRLF